MLWYSDLFRSDWMRRTFPELVYPVIYRAYPPTALSTLAIDLYSLTYLPVLNLFLGIFIENSSELFPFFPHVCHPQ